MRGRIEPTASLLSSQEYDTVKNLHDSIQSDQNLEEDELLEYTEELFGFIRSVENEWKESVRDELEPDAVNRKAVKLKYLTEKLEELYQEHRSQIQGNRFHNFPEDVYLKVNDVITYVNDLGTDELYDGFEPQEGDFCLIQEGPNSWENTYLNPQSVSKKDLLDELYPKARK
jgi:hypothetical protein